MQCKGRSQSSNLWQSQRAGAVFSTDGQERDLWGLLLHHCFFDFTLCLSSSSFRHPSLISPAPASLFHPLRNSSMCVRVRLEERHLSMHVPECMYVWVCEKNEVCLTCACRHPQDPQPQLTGLWMLDGGFYDLVKTGYIIQSSIHSEREKAKRERWIERKREGERERGRGLSEILMNSLMVGGKTIVKVGREGRDFNSADFSCVISSFTFCLI